MALPLAPHVHLAILGDDVVLLDLRADAYLCLRDGRTALRPRSDRGAVSPVDRETREALVEAGWVDVGRADGASPGGRPRLSPPTADIGTAATERLGWRDAARLCGALWDLARRYRGRSLQEILGFVAQPVLRPVADAWRCDRAAEVLRLARVFHRVGPWLPIPDKCLVRSFVLLCFLQRSGVTAEWMFGVRTWPFAAHCWLQHGEVALDDAADRLAAYAPILAVG